MTNRTIYVEDVDRVREALRLGAVTMSGLVRRLGIKKPNGAVYRTVEWMQGAGLVRVVIEGEMRMFELVEGTS